MENKYQQKYRVLSSRAQWHNYNCGVYFITICTDNHNHYFGKIYNNEMHLSVLGEFIENEFNNISQHNPDCEVPVFVIMPNHIHAIIFIDQIDNKNRYDCNENYDLKSFDKMSKISLMKGRLSIVVGSIKRSVTYFAKINNIPFKWQPRFYDRIIRGFDEMNNIGLYIENNIIKWETDKYYG